jgi:anti-anti-sigma factor
MDGRLAGEVDLAVAPEAGRRLLAIAQDSPRPSVVFDCVELTFIDASGITMLLDVTERSGKAVKLVNLTTSCRRVFDVLDLCEWFGIAECSSIALGASEAS